MVCFEHYDNSKKLLLTSLFSPVFKYIYLFIYFAQPEILPLLKTGGSENSLEKNKIGLFILSGMFNNQTIVLYSNLLLVLCLGD